MFLNYLKIALRNLMRQKVNSFINITSLTIGMACCVLILLWVVDELSFDRFHEQADRIYRLCAEMEIGGFMSASVVSAPMAEALQEIYPEVAKTARYMHRGSMSVQYGDKEFKIEPVGCADNSLFEIFSFPFLAGDPKTALQNAHTVVLTEETASKLFGSETALGKILKTVDGRDFTVTGVLKKVPPNSHLNFEMIYSFATLKHEIPGVLDNWFIFRFSTYLLLKENTNYRMLEQKFPQFIENHFEEVLTATGGKIRLMLQPLTQIHLHSRFTSHQDSDSDILYVYLFSGIAVFILLIACINFINLTVARATTRTKEVGVRKTFGAGKHKLIHQFLIESLLYSFIAMTMAGILIEISLPLFNSLAGRNLNLNYFQKPELLAGQFLLALIVGILAGAYPAFFMSAFQPLRVMKRNLTTGSRHVQLRHILVVFQFVIAVAMIIGSITVYRQIGYIQSHKFTFEKERIVVMPSMSHEMRTSFKSTTEELKRIPGIVEVAAASTIPGRGLEKSVMQPEGIPPDQPQTMNVLSVDPNFIPFLGLKIIEGRNFSDDLVTDREQAVIINEKAARQFGWTNPLGKTFRIDSDQGEGETSHFKTVVGVIQDFHLTSMRNMIEPLYIDCETGNLYNLMLKVDMVNLPLTLEQLKKNWKELNPRQGFHYFFLDETFDRLYRAEMRLSKLVLYFTILAIFIGGMGLYAISTFAATRRTKEIGVRKVLGATKSGIITLLSREFLLLVIIAILLAWPIAYYGLDKWLQGYAYHISLNWGTFLLAGFLALLISLVTVSFQALKAASTDPVKSLRYE